MWVGGGCKYLPVETQSVYLMSSFLLTYLNDEIGKTVRKELCSSSIGQFGVPVKVTLETENCSVQSKQV